MTYRIREQSAQKNTKIKDFFSGIGSIISLSPEISSVAYKSQSQDRQMLTQDMQKIGNDFRVAVEKVVTNARG